MQSPKRLVALILALSLALVACGEADDDGPGAQTPAAPAGETPGNGASPAETDSPQLSGELTVWAMGNEGALLGTLADAFMEEYPDVSVSVTPIDWGQAVTRLQTAIGGRQTPDVSQMGTDMMGQFVETGALAAIPDTFDQGRYFESAWQTGVVDGTAYGVPWYVETRVLYYRSDLAEQAGITEAPGDWDALKEAAQAMQQSGAEWGLSLGTMNWQEYVPFLWSNGGQIMDDQGNFQLDSPEAIEALEYYYSYFQEGLSPSSVPEGFDITPAFVRGTHPMFFSGPWHMGLIDEAGGEGTWEIATLPRRDSATSFVGGSNLVVFEDSQNKDAAWAFVEFLSRPDIQIRWYEEATVLPAVQAAWDDPALADDERVAVFGEQLQDTQAQPAIPTWSEIASAINEQLERVTAGAITPEEGARAMQQAAESIGTGR